MKRAIHSPLALLLTLAPYALLAQGTSVTPSPFESIPWQDGPATAAIGGESEITLPENCRFTGRDGARQFMIATENPPSGDELGVLVCQPADEEESPWFVVFTFDESGYVRDDEGGSLDADALLASIRAGTEEGNRERRSRGWAVLTIDGWVRKPYYDVQSNNLTFAMKATSSDAFEGSTVNHSVRLLGRRGVMRADLVVSPEQLETALPAFDRIVASHSFVAGKRYDEWREGDKVAAYGLTALVAGGAGAIAAKTGLLAKLWKVLVVAVVGVGAWLKSLFTGKPPTRPDRDAQP
ncbi:MAG TPA: DUF2167 domain-containing protein [Longimicrobium sp.]|nr:DUF2167 domain-containing protein [Longimicrobium sp.]